MIAAGAFEARNHSDADAPPADAILAARLCALDPHGLGGMILRGGGAKRDAVTRSLIAALPAGAPVRRLPAHADDDRLLGGLDLGAALATGVARLRPGLLSEADGGLVIVPMAERLSAATAARLGAALDRGAVQIERDGSSFALPARIAVVALDDGIDEAAPAALAERLAFRFDLDSVVPVDEDGATKAIDEDEALATLTATAMALGIDSSRATVFALRAARASAKLDGRATLTERDVMRAARLVLAPRATRMPTAPDEEQGAPPPPPPPGDGADNEGDGNGALEDRVLAATAAALPPDVLASLAQGGLGRGVGRRARGAGERRRSPTRGRPAGVRAGQPGGGKRLALVETLRAAAPWQRLRGRTDRVLVRKDDLRVRRFEARAELVTIVAVDASGSAAAARLAEAKGAVELLLAQAYVQRAEVALVAFRGTAAEILLPPTRSLARARRALAELPGGGGTPLATGLIAARELAQAVRARGRTPFLVLLSDGRANIAADGSAGRPTAERDALAAARNIALDGVSAVVIDTAPRADPRAAALADAMRARCIALPYAGASGIEAAVSALATQAR